MNNVEQSLINYIKSKYQKIIFNPVKLIDNTVNKGLSLGFIVSDKKLIIGYINNKGYLCKLIDPIDLNNLSNERFVEIINNLPIIKGVEKDDLLKLLNNTDKDKDTYKDLKDELFDIKAKYDVLLSKENDILFIKKEYSSKVEEIKIEYENEILQLKNEVKKVDILREECKNKLLNEKTKIIDGIQLFKEEISVYLNDILINNKSKYNELNDTYIKLLKDKGDIEYNLRILTEKEKDSLKTFGENQDIISDFSNKLRIKEDEVKKLNKTITDIKDELNKVENKFNEKELENVILGEFNKNCIEQILNEKDTIIENIKLYNSKWIEWVNENNIDIETQKTKLKNDLNVIFSNLQKVMKSKNSYIDKLTISSKQKDMLINKLNSNVSDIKHQVNKSLTDQLLQLNIKNEELNKKSQNDDDILKSKMIIIDDLSKKLEHVKTLLDKNASINIQYDIDYDNCYDTLQKFMNVNNMFYRKKEIISLLDNIIKQDNISSFNNLNDIMKINIKNKFEKVKTEINKHIDFLDLNKYIQSPNIKLFKSKSTVKSVPREFCDELNNISIYWSNNISTFREQDRILTNIYEDISGAVRVYIKIKPLIGNEQKNNTVYIENNKLTIDCSNVVNVNKKETFGEFYGIFDDNFSNKDVYTGIQGSGDISDLNVVIDENAETVSPGLYSTFKQVEDGYSIVLFGYGLSGSGKTRLLLGEKSVPGLLHYGLSNLNGVKNIKLKYLFEQYIDKFVPTINKIRGKIINLVREVPQLRNYSIDETKEFSEYINDKINVNNLHINDINTLTSLLDQYRKNHLRIKQTPNNPVSSRSHLYMVYEVSFENNKTGYITIVDTAGRESPTNIYNMFIDTSRINLTSILGPTGGPEIVKRYLKPEYSSYDSVNVYNILKEGFYINETINHLIYFFNKKNYKKTKIVSQTNLDKYSNDRYYVNPQTEENIIDPVNNCLMVPILKFLDVISNKNKNEDNYRPTKFITMVSIRKEIEYCPQIFSSMEFASKIKSS